MNMLDWSGAVAPSVFYRPPWLSSVGRDVVELAGSTGLFYDTWQILALEEMLGRTTVEPWDLVSRWATPEVGLVIARQNGKDAIIEGICLASLFLWRESFVHSAHQFKTTKKAFLRLRGRILANPDLRKRLLQPIEGRGITTGVGNEGIHLAETMDNGDPLEGMYVARSGGSGRGWTVPRVLYNEAWELDEDAIAAQTPAQSTMPDPQTIYITSPPDKEKHQNARVIGGLRTRALTGDDPDLAWLEWTAGDRKSLPGEMTEAAKARRHDEAAYRRANPSFEIVRPDGSRGVRAAFLHRQARSPMGPRWFDVEHLGIGDWPTSGDEQWLVIAEPYWHARAGARPRPEPWPPLTLAIASSYPDAGWTSLAACWRDGDDLVGELVDRRPGTEWAIPRCDEIAAKLDSEDRVEELLAVAIAKSGPAGAVLLPELEDSELPILPVDPGGECQAAAGLKDDVAGLAPTFRHYGQETVTTSVGRAEKHHLGDRWRFSRTETSDAVEAVSLARHAHVLRWRPDLDLAETVW